MSGKWPRHRQVWWAIRCWWQIHIAYLDWRYWRLQILETWDRLRCGLTGHDEQPLWPDDPGEDDTYCTRCRTIWMGGRDYSETRIWFVEK